MTSLESPTTSSIETQAQQVLEWILQYRDNIRGYPVTPQVKPGDVLAQLPTTPPQKGEEFEALLTDFEQIIVPAMTHWQHPKFFGYFPANTSTPSLWAEMLTSALGAQCMSWITSPAATELEERVMEWIQSALSLPSEWVGVIQDTASTATLCALLTAREKATNYEANHTGLYGRAPMTVYCSEQAHSSIEKAVRMAGLGVNYLRKIAVDDTNAMQAEALEAAILADQQAGLTPLCVVGAFGTTGTTAVDPLAAIGQICQKHGLWFHIDAAFAGSAMILPQVRAQAQGIEYADSFVFNPHKWLFTHFDCSAYYVKSESDLTRTFGLTPEYLKTAQDKEVNNYRDWGVQLGRRFRALKLWFVLRSYGIEGLQDKIQHHLDLSQMLLKKMQAHPEFEVLCPVNFNTLCFRHHPGGMSHDELNAHNQALMHTLNQSGEVFFTHTLYRDHYVIRWVIGQTEVQKTDVIEAWKLVQKTAQSLL